jgi:hypothetical protein
MTTLARAPLHISAPEGVSRGRWLDPAPDTNTVPSHAIQTKETLPGDPVTHIG